MNDPMDEATGQGEILWDAIERSGQPRKVVAGAVGVHYNTLDGWVREDHRIPLRALGPLSRVLGAWFVNQFLEPGGFTAIKLETRRQGRDIFDDVRDVALRLGGATGSVTLDVADAIAGSSPGGTAITHDEADRIRGSINEAKAYLQALEERLGVAAGTN